MKTWLFAKKSFLEMWRSPQLFWLYLLFPGLMVLIYYSAYGQNNGMSNFLTVIVENQDHGILGAGLVQELRNARFDGKPLLTLIEGITRDESETYLNEGRASMLISIPPDFTSALTTNPTRPAAIEMLGDPLNDTYAFAYSFLGELIRQYADGITGWNKTLLVSQEYLPNTGTMNDFQVGVPGLIVFGIMFGIILYGLLLSSEKSSGTIRRIQLSNVRSSHFLGGVAITGTGLTLAQTLITLAVAAGVGYRPVGSIWLVIAISLVCGLGAMGMGFLAASISRNGGEATAYATGLMVPFVFLTGAIFPMPFTAWFKLGSITVQPYDLVPTTHAVQALKKVMLYGTGIPGMAYELIMLTLLSILFLAAGIWFYQKMSLDK
jgi:ABC-2 type transport system permease protein